MWRGTVVRSRCTPSAAEKSWESGPPIVWELETCIALWYLFHFLKVNFGLHVNLTHASSHCNKTTQTLFHSFNLCLSGIHKSWGISVAYWALKHHLNALLLPNALQSSSSSPKHFSLGSLQGYRATAPPAIYHHSVLSPNPLISPKNQTSQTSSVTIRKHSSLLAFVYLSCSFFVLSSGHTAAAADCPSPLWLHSPLFTFP